MQRFYKIIISICLAVYGPVAGAQDLVKKVPVISMVSSVPLIRYSIHPDWKMGPPAITHEVNERKSGQELTDIKNRAVTGSIAANLYTEWFGFFCKKELALEKSVKVPLRFRLGSLEYTDRLEGKNR